MSGINGWPIESVILVGCQTFRVNSLSGFVKRQHRIPDEASDRAQAFIAKIAQKELEDDLDQVFDNLRRTLGMKRTELLSTDPENGVGQITTALFDYQNSVQLDADDLTQVFFRRQISNLHTLETIDSGGLDEVFCNTFESVELISSQAIDIEKLIDRLEDLGDENMVIDYDRHATWCQLSFERMPGVMVFRSEGVTLEKQETASPSALVSSLIAMGDKLTDIAIPTS